MLAQPQPSLPARANVVPYYDESGIMKDAYRESPYYLEITGGWQQKETDSSIRYTRQLEAEANWKDYLVYLNVRAGRAVRVIVNEKEVGYDGDSRHWNEFLLSPYIKPGRSNTLTVETMRQAREALLEDPSLTVGLNGEPYLLFKNDPNVVDYSIVADYEAATATGIFTLSADVFCSKRKGKYYLDVEVWDSRGRSFDRMGRWVVFNGKNEETVEVNRSWTDVKPWSAEDPALYTAVIRLRNEKMEEEETVGARFGFRRVEVKDGLLQLNGKSITLRGVTYGIQHTEGEASRLRMQRDVEAMKRNNINAVRTAQYSPIDPFFYELCDRYGLYVVCDANLHPLSEQHRVVATDQDYLPLFERRVENLYGKYKNHASIIAWSLGNSRDNGVCMTAAYRRLKAKDKTRPVIFSGANHSETTDIIAPMRPQVKSLHQLLKKQSARPYLMLSIVDTSCFPTLEPLWDEVGSNRQMQGGFVDAWPLSTIQLAELKHLYRPFDVRLEKITVDDGDFVVFNRNDFVPFGRYSFDYNICTNLRTAISGGELAVVPTCGGSDKFSVRIPRVDLQAGEEMFIRFNLRSKSQPSVLMGTVEYPLPQKQRPRTMYTGQNGTSSGSIDSVLVRQVLYFVGHEDWSVDCVDRLERHIDANTRCVDQMMRYKAPDGTTMCDVRTTYTRFNSGDVVVDYTFAPADHTLDGKLKPAILIWHDADSITWYGLDREVCFDVNNSGLSGIYTQAASNIVRQQVRWCATHRDGSGLFVELLGTNFSILSDNHHMRLVPQTDDAIRLHLRKYRNTNPVELTGWDFPRMASGILNPPIIKADEARFSQPLSVTIASSQSSDIHYTLDGSDPTEVSPRYVGPITIASTTVVKARAYAKDTPPSFTSTRRFNYDYIVKTTFSRKANTPYNAGADTILFDGERGNVDDLTRGWIGFSGEPVVTTVQLARPINVDHITLRYAHAPATWAFVPRQVFILLSSDGSAYTDTITATIPFDPTEQDENTSRVVELKVPVNKSDVGYLKIQPETIGIIPAWHRAKGLKPWLLMDEIEVIEQ